MGGETALPGQGGFFPGAPTKAESRFVLLGGIEIPVATTEREMIPGSTVSGLEISEKSLDLKVKNAKIS